MCLILSAKYYLDDPVTQAQAQIRGMGNEEWGEIFLFPFCRISFDDNFGFGFKTRITESKSEMIKVAAVNATHSS